MEGLLVPLGDTGRPPWFRVGERAADPVEGDRQPRWNRGACRGTRERATRRGRPSHPVVYIFPFNGRVESSRYINDLRRLLPLLRGAKVEVGSRAYVADVALTNVKVSSQASHRRRSPRIRSEGT